MSRSAHAKGKRRFHAKFAHARFIVIPYPVCNRYDLGMQIINICHGMCCPSLQWHRTGYRWANIAGGALVVWPGSYGPYSRTVVVIKLGAARRFADPSHTHTTRIGVADPSHTHTRLVSRAPVTMSGGRAPEPAGHGASKSMERGWALAKPSIRVS